jgi:hypothetical protein
MVVSIWATYRERVTQTGPTNPNLEETLESSRNGHGHMKRALDRRSSTPSDPTGHLTPEGKDDNGTARIPTGSSQLAAGD